MFDVVGGLDLLCWRSGNQNTAFESAEQMFFGQRSKDGNKPVAFRATVAVHKSFDCKHLQHSPAIANWAG